MYAWIWRHLPFGRLGRSFTALALLAAIAALLWYVIFPVIEPRLPFNDGQIDTGQEGPTAPAPAGSPGVQPQVSPTG